MLCKALLLLSATLTVVVAEDYDEFFGPMDAQGQPVVGVGNETNSSSTTTTTITTITTTTTTIREDIIQFGFFKEVAAAPATTPAVPATTVRGRVRKYIANLRSVRQSSEVSCEEEQCSNDVTRDCFTNKCTKGADGFSINTTKFKKCADVADTCKKCYPGNCGTSGKPVLMGHQYLNVNCSDKVKNTFSVPLDNGCTEIMIPGQDGKFFNYYVKADCGRILTGTDKKCKEKDMNVWSSPMNADSSICYKGFDEQHPYGMNLWIQGDCTRTTTSRTTTLPKDTPELVATVYHEGECGGTPMGSGSIEPLPLTGACFNFSNPTNGATWAAKGTCESLEIGPSCAELEPQDFRPKDTNASDCKRPFPGSNGTSYTTRVTGCGEEPPATTAPVITTPKPKDFDCSLQTENTGAYFAQLEAHGCDCVPMPEPPRNWTSWGWAEADASRTNSYYQLSMINGKITAFNAFCNKECGDCQVSRTQNGKGYAECNATTELVGEAALGYQTCALSKSGTSSWMVRGPGSSPEACILDPVVTFVDERAVTVVEYPEKTFCDSKLDVNKTEANQYRQNHAIVAWSIPGTIMGETQGTNPDGSLDQGACTEMPDGTYARFDQEITAPAESNSSSAAVVTVSGLFNCMSNQCETTSCDQFHKVPQDACVEIQDEGEGNGVSLRIFKTAMFLKSEVCGGADKPPEPSKKTKKSSGSKMVIIGAAVGGVAVLLIVFIVIRQRRAAKSRAYAVLSGSEYVD